MVKLPQLDEVTVVAVEVLLYISYTDGTVLKQIGLRQTTLWNDEKLSLKLKGLLSNKHYAKLSTIKIQQFHLLVTMLHCAMLMPHKVFFFFFLLITNWNVAFLDYYFIKKNWEGVVLLLHWFTNYILVPNKWADLQIKKHLRSVSECYMQKRSMNVLLNALPAMAIEYFCAIDRRSK